MLSNGPDSIEIDPDSELGRALDEIDSGSVFLICGGKRFRVTQATDDLWAAYEPERVRAGLRAFSGIISPAEGECIKATIYRGRDEGTRPLDRP